MKGIVEKVLSYEKALPGLWRKKIFLLGGLFGQPAVDQVVETAVSGLLDREIPYDLDLQVLRIQGPYSVGAGDTREFFRKKLSEGCLMAIYAGHAGPRKFSTPVPNQKPWIDLFTAEDAETLSVSSGAPILVSFACHAGSFAEGKASIADSSIRNPKGPVAYLGASGISDPIPDLLLAHEMTRLFGSSRDLTFGELLIQAKRAALEGEDDFHKQVEAGATLFGFGPEKQKALMRFEFWIYNLHGDPALRIQRPRGRIQLHFDAVSPPGPLKITGEVEGISEGECVLSLELPRSKQGASALCGNEPAENLWRMANNKVLDQVGVEVHGGKFEAQVDLLAPQTSGEMQPIAPGRYYLKAYARDREKDAAGSASFEVK